MFTSPADRNVISGSVVSFEAPAIVRANFGPEQFDKATVAAWLAFYVLAQESDEARRLWRVYARRLSSNLNGSLKRLTDRSHAARIATGTAAMIDGLYIRCALAGKPADAREAIALVEDYVDVELRGVPAS